MGLNVVPFAHASPSHLTLFGGRKLFEAFGKNSKQAERPRMVELGKNNLYVLLLYNARIVPDNLIQQDREFV